MPRRSNARPAAPWRADRGKGHHRYCRPADQMGSPIYRGHRPANDAACVALLRAAGAVILGKTVTCEFAGMTPGATTNPHNTAHTPGGSSSGSGPPLPFMVPIALGHKPAVRCFDLLPTAASSASSPLSARSTAEASIRPRKKASTQSGSSPDGSRTSKLVATVLEMRQHRQRINHSNGLPVLGSATHRYGTPRSRKQLLPVRTLAEAFKSRRSGANHYVAG